MKKYLIGSLLALAIIIISTFVGPNFATAVITTKNQTAVSVESPTAKGFIIQLREPSLVERQAIVERLIRLGQRFNLSTELNLQRSRIVFQRDSFRARLVAAIRQRNLTPRYFTNVFNGLVLDITATEAEILKSLPEVKAVFPNQTVKADLLESVPLIGADRLWPTNVNFNTAICTPGSNACLTGAGIDVAIIDTGVDYNNPAFSFNYSGGYDVINNDADPMDDHGHGTHVASIVSDGYSVPNVGLRGVVKGVAPDANIWAYKVLNDGGSGSSETVIAGIERAVDPNQDGNFSDRAEVMNLSLGGGGSPDDPVSQAVDNAVAAGSVMVVAAGNSGGQGSIGSPGTARQAITVGATDKQDQLAYFSSGGPVEWIDASDNKVALMKPDIVAPGVDICAAQWAEAWADRHCLDDDHTSISGTSMATPHVAGLVALIRQAHPDWDPAQVKMVLRQTAKKLPSYEQWAQGYGRVQAWEAVHSVKLPVALFNTVQVASPGKINIRGTAESFNQNGADGRYTLSYGIGLEPRSFITFYTSPAYTSIKDSILYSNFDTTLLPEGYNTIKLTVTNSAGKSSEDRLPIFVNNIEITAPLNNDIYRLGEKLKIIGSLPAGASFTVKYCPTAQIDSCASVETLIASGVGPIANGLLANWDTANLPEGAYNLILGVRYANGRVTREQVSSIYLDPTLKVGWPQRVNFEFQKYGSNSNGQSLITSPNADYIVLPPRSGSKDQSINKNQSTVLTKEEFNKINASSFKSLSGDSFYYWAGMLEPVAYDLDNDGNKEIIVYQSGNPPKVLVYRQDGSLFWSKTFGSGDVPGGNLTIPLVGDLDNDGFGEIVAYNFEGERWLEQVSSLTVFNHDGSILWSTLVPQDYHPTMLMVDLDNDGKKEIVIKGNNYDRVAIVDSLGRISKQWQWPINPDRYFALIESSPAIGNFDSDPDLEIVYTNPTERAGFDWDSQQWINEAAIYVFNRDGSVVPGWPVYILGSISSSPAIGDIDNDGKEDIVIGFIYASNTFPDDRYGGLYAFNRQGQIMPGWPFKKGWNFWSTPSLADVNSDGKLEIAASSLGFETHLLNYRGELLPGWPQMTTWNDYYGSLIGDINNDSKLDIITTAGDGFLPTFDPPGGVYAWSSTGQRIFVKRTEVDAQAPAVIDDIDQDGKLELIASSNEDLDISDYWDPSKYRGSIYVWELAGQASKRTLPWPTFQHDTQHTGRYGFSATTTTSTPKLSLIAPNGGEVLGQGDTRTITWQAPIGRGATSTYDLYLRPASVSSTAKTLLTTKNLIARSLSGVSFQWKVGTFLDGAKVSTEPNFYIIRICQSDTTICDESDQPFKIIGPLTLTAPNGGEVWQLGSSHTIKWTPYDPNTGINPASQTTAYLEKLINNNFVTVGKVIEDGRASIHWSGQIDGPNNYPDSGNYYIRVVNNVTGAMDRSNQPFTLVAQGTLTADLKINDSDGPLTIPSGGVEYPATWASNTETCTIYNNTLPVDDPNYQLSNLPPSGSKVIKLLPIAYGTEISLWCKSAKIEGDAGDRVMVLGTSGGSVSVVNNTNTSVVTSLAVVTPNGGEKIDRLSPYRITWNLSSDINNVSIALYKNDASFAWIATNLPASTRSYNWQPSDIISVDQASGEVFKIYILGYKTSGGTIEDKSNAPFGFVSTVLTPAPPLVVIQPLATSTRSFIVLYPNGLNDMLYHGQTNTIRWSSTNLPASTPIQIEFIPSDTRQFHHTITNLTNTGSYDLNLRQDFDIKSFPSGYYLLEVRAYIDGQFISDRSDNLFQILSTSKSQVDSSTQYAAVLMSLRDTLEVLAKQLSLSR